MLAQLPTVSLTGTLSLLVGFIINVIVLWIAQKAVLPTDKEKDVISVAALALIGSIANWILSILIPYWLLYKLIYLVIWVWLIAKWFDVGYVLAAAIAFVAWLVHLLLDLVIGVVKLAAALLP